MANAPSNVPHQWHLTATTGAEAKGGSGQCVHCMRLLGGAVKVLFVYGLTIEERTQSLALPKHRLEHLWDHEVIGELAVFADHYQDWDVEDFLLHPSIQVVEI